MFRTPSTFVVGAGASDEFGFPIGSQLKSQIRDALDFQFENWIDRPQRGDRRIWEALKVDADRRGVKSLEEYIEAAHRLRRALPLSPSIDNCLFNHADDPLAVVCGKVAIATLILDHERKSGLISKGHHPLDFADNALQSTYLSRLLTLAGTDVEKSSPAMFRNVSFIIFNYDRCVERYLHEGLQALFAISSEEASALLAPVKFVHPYGSLGKLPGIQHTEGRAVGFGAEKRAGELLDIADNIRTFTERHDDDEFLAQLKGAYAGAQRFYFLGFGFLNQNLELLRIADETNRPYVVRHAFATAIGVDDADREMVQSKIMNTFGKDAGISSATLFNKSKCSQLFDQLWHTMQR